MVDIDELAAKCGGNKLDQHDYRSERRQQAHHPRDRRQRQLQEAGDLLRAGKDRRLLRHAPRDHDERNGGQRQHEHAVDASRASCQLITDQRDRKMTVGGGG